MRATIYKSLYAQVILAILIGALLGHFEPAFASKLKPLGEGFIRLIKMLIAPLVFSTIVVGIASMGDLKKVGRVGAKTLLYFEVVTSFALLIGLVVVRTVEPGSGMNVDASALDTRELNSILAGGQKVKTTTEFLLNIIPENVVEAFAKGEMLQVLLFAVLFGSAASAMGENARPVIKILDEISHILFKVVGMIMKVAPVGAFGAMAFTVGKYGIGALANLGLLMACFYVTSLLFVFVVLGGIARLVNVNIWSFLRYIKEELLLVLGTSSSESALPLMLRKMEDLGCARSVVGLVIPTGYSFNLDGTSIYLTMAAIFVAQATNTPLTLGDELGLLGVLLLTSKGAAAVTGGGFITLAATLSSTGTIPVAGLALLLGIDRFMSEARALTNLVGNGVATLVIAKWEGALDEEKLHAALKRPV